MYKRAINMLILLKIIVQIVFSEKMFNRIPLGLDYHIKTKQMIGGKCLAVHENSKAKSMKFNSIK